MWFVDQDTKWNQTLITLMNVFLDNKNLGLGSSCSTLMHKQVNLCFWMTMDWSNVEFAAWLKYMKVGVRCLKCNYRKGLLLTLFQLFIKATNAIFSKPQDCNNVHEVLDKIAAYNSWHDSFFLVDVT
jgi:hypothetical protein